MRARATKPDPEGLYVCVASFATDVPRRGIVCVQGARLLGSDPIVAIHGRMFVPDGAPSEVENAARSALNEGQPSYAAPPTMPKPARWIPASKAMVAIAHAGGVAVGERVERKHEGVKKAKEAFVPVIADDALKGSSRDALQLRGDFGTIVHRDTDGDAVIIVYPGQQVHRDHPAVSLHPHAWAHCDPRDIEAA